MRTEELECFRYLELGMSANGALGAGESLCGCGAKVLNALRNMWKDK